MSAVRRADAGDRDRGTEDIEADPGQSHFAPRRILHLCLRKLREKRHLNAHRESAEGAGCDSRQLCLARGHRPHRGAEICDVRTAVPAGAGMGTAGAEAVLADHVQLGAAGSGRSSAAGL